MDLLFSETKKFTLYFSFFQAPLEILLVIIVAKRLPPGIAIMTNSSEKTVQIILKVAGGTRIAITPT